MPTAFTRYCKTLVASGARTTGTGSTDTCIMPDDVIGGTFYLHVTSQTATTPTLDVAYRVTPDDGTTFYAVLRHAQTTTTTEHTRYLNVTFAPWLTAGTEGLTAVTGGALCVNVGFSRLFSVYWTIGGTANTATFDVTFIGFRLPNVGF